MFKRVSLALFAVLLATMAVSAQTKLLRFPDIHGDKVVFTYGGDLWTALTSGGTATRLTAHTGVENHAKFSPDGKWIAFTGQYDGDEQVYVMPSGGGEPKQLTFYPARGPLTPRWGFDNQVNGWTKDGKILFRSLRDAWTLGVTKLYTVSPDGGPAEALPMPEAGSGDYSPDGSKMVYSPRFRDFRPEKRYSGGQANTLYIYTLANADAVKISDNPRAARDAMWIGNTVYYNSDKDGKFNLYGYNTANAKTTQITTNKDWDIRWPSSDNVGKIVYEKDGELEVFDVNSKRANKLTIEVPNDGVNRRTRQQFVGNAISSYSLSPKGERALFSARGDIFSVPIEKGGVRNLTRSSTAHDKNPTWSPDGRWIAFLSDKTGEEEVYVIPQDGSAPAQQLTTGGQAQRYQPNWSPDGKKIAFSDKDGKLYVVTVATKQVVMVADAPNGFINDYDWSPKSNYIAYVMGGKNGLSQIYIWNSADQKSTRVTSPYFNSQSVAFDPAGNYLYFLSDREFAPQISGAEFNYATNRTTMIYALALKKDTKNPFPFENDEVTFTPEPAASGTGAPPAAGATPAAPRPAVDNTPEVIDLDGIEKRATKAPLPADNYAGLSANRGHLLYVIQGSFYYGRQSDSQPSLRIYSLKDRKETTLLSPAFGYAISADGTKIMSNAMGQYAVLDANPMGDRSRKNVSTAGMTTEINPVEEWNQIFNEAWRRYRDWFYVENMHGFDWAKIREDYRKWLPYVSHRSDLNYILSEMASELTVQHAYVEGGDFQLPPRVAVALPGARFEADKSAGRYKISKIFGGQNEEDIYRSPLTEVGSTANVGDYILTINGEDVTTGKDIYAYFRGKAGSAVTMTVNSTPSATGARTITFRPITNESDLVYLDWTEGNRQRVAEMTNGRVGYLHIPDMGGPGIREFIKWYYPQIDKEGMVVDVRANGGGNVSRMIIERLRRKVLAVNFRRGAIDPSTYPDGAFHGPMAAILNENSSSDGDIFPWMFKQAGLGPLIGKRSWGGVVGISGRGGFIDGGSVSVPESALTSMAGEYVIEGYGVDPDIEVDNDPKSVIAGKDPQLERAVQEVMKKLASAPMKLPNRPADPNKNKP